MLRLAALFGLHVVRQEMVDAPYIGELESRATCATTVCVLCGLAGHPAGNYVGLLIEQGML